MFKAEAVSSYPFNLTFHNLTYNVKCSKKAAAAANEHSKKMLLNNISGQAREGQITAVLGASGSGKSTLIDALAGRISKQSLEGSVALNGQEVLQCNTNVIKSLAAYVMQDDLLYPMLTVEETLMFSAELRLPRTMSKLKKRQRVEEIILQLGLRDAAQTMIGDEGYRGVSGGERRRVSIGIDIIHGPIILFLDEPTSGMDSTNAFLVVRVLQSIARNGSIVVLAIHQPSSRILSLIDHLLILSDGQMVYTGSPSGLTDFFTALDHQIPEDENAAEFALDFISELKGSIGGTAGFVEDYKTWQKIRAFPQDPDRKPSGMMFLKDAVIARISAGKLFASGVMVSSFANPIWVEIRVIGTRSVINSTRKPESFLLRFGAVVVAGVMLATIFRRLDDSPKGAQERVGFFASAITTTFFICAEAIPYIFQERSIFIRETAYNSYRTSSYVLSQALTALPSLIILSFTFCAITFWSVGLEGRFLGFGWFFSFMVASFWVGHSFVTFISAVAPHIMISYIMVVSLIAQFMLFSGLFISRDRIPRYWIWFHYMSLVKYPYQGVLLNEFDNPMKCFVTGTQMFDNTPLKSASKTLKAKVLESMSKTVGIDITSTCLITGSDILQQQGATDLSKLQCLLITVACGFLFRILFYVVLQYGYKGKRT